MAGLCPPVFGSTTLAVCGERHSGAARNEVGKTSSLVYARTEESTRSPGVAADAVEASFRLCLTTSMFVVAPNQHFLEQDCFDVMISKQSRQETCSYS